MSSDGGGPRDPVDLALHQATKSQEDLIELRKALDGMRETQQVMGEYHKLRAEMRHEQFQTYTQAGFTRAEALELLKADQ